MNREAELASALRGARALKRLPAVGTELAAYADLVEARAFAAECNQTVDEWFNFGDLLDEPAWAEAYALHLKLIANHEG